MRRIHKSTSLAGLQGLPETTLAAERRIIFKNGEVPRREAPEGTRVPEASPEAQREQAQQLLRQYEQKREKALAVVKKYLKENEKYPVRVKIAESYRSRIENETEEPNALRTHVLKPEDVRKNLVQLDIIIREGGKAKAGALERPKIPAEKEAAGAPEWLKGEVLKPHLERLNASLTAATNKIREIKKNPYTRSLVDPDKLFAGLIRKLMSLRETAMAARDPKVIEAAINKINNIATAESVNDVLKRDWAKQLLMDAAGRAFEKFPRVDLYSVAEKLKSILSANENLRGLPNAAYSSMQNGISFTVSKRGDSYSVAFNSAEQWAMDQYPKVAQYFKEKEDRRLARAARRKAPEKRVV